MDSIQEQVVTLTHKVDALHEMLNQLNLQITEILAKASVSSKGNGFEFERFTSEARAAGISSSQMEGFLDHKDILADSGYASLDRASGDQHLSPEVQIQRLTAQLTAAYNRIAALEEQLLAARSYS